MIYFVCADGGVIGYGYNCFTCDDILRLDLESGEEYYEGHVDNCLDKGQTPEQYLEQLKNSKLIN
jgi:hypothetical protein